jgi:hypothetical protein
MVIGVLIKERKKERAYWHRGKANVTSEAMTRVETQQQAKDCQPEVG